MPLCSLHSKRTFPRTMLIRCMSRSLSTLTTTPPPSNARDSSALSPSNEHPATPTYEHKEEREGTRRASATQQAVMLGGTASQAGTCISSRHGHVASAFPMALLHTHAPKKFWCHSTASAMFFPYLLWQVTWRS